ncbi:MAG: hypothetical protein QOD99_1383, partial [Chthoniobacter sp.]|nr:hypothetical protein [Chthoniobacter sp.]
LTIAGPIIDGRLFDEKIQPFLNDEIRYVGLVNHQEKNDYFARSACAILPFRGEEPFGVVNIEAMACGTPVVGLANGALPEIVDQGVTGYLAETEAELPGLIQRAMALSRGAIRKRVMERFNIGLVAQKYLSLYQRIGISSKAP